MIYQKIVEKLNDILGGDYDLSYANNHDTNWASILPEAEDKIKYGVLRVDSGTTTQVSNTTIRVEQLRLMVAIPEDREIFNEAVNKLRSLLEDINDLTISEDISNTPSDATDDLIALLYSGAYNDAQASIVNGNRWWIAEVTFLANFYNGIYNSTNTSLTLLKSGDTTTYEISGLLSVNYSMNKVMDSNVYAGSGKEQKNAVMSITKQITFTTAYMNKTYLDKILDNEDEDTKYTITYNNGKKTRTLSNMILANINESIIIGDIVKGTFTFIVGE